MVPLIASLPLEEDIPRYTTGDSKFFANYFSVAKARKSTNSSVFFSIKLHQFTVNPWLSDPRLSIPRAVATKI